MKKFEELNNTEKEKFNSYLNLKGLMRNDYNSNVILAFIILLFGAVLSMSIALIGLNLISIGLDFDSGSVVQGGFNVIGSSSIATVAFMLIFVLILFLAYYRKQQDEKLLYMIFEINDVTKDIMDINKEDIKKIRFGWRKVK